MTAFSLIETMRAEPGIGIHRSRLHKARFTNSARKLGFPESDAAWIAVESKAQTLTTLNRLRLELHSDGKFDIAAVQFALQHEDTIWKVRIASKTRLGSHVPLLRHKTSLRGVYDAARGEFDRDDADEVILMNEKDEICEGTITNLFVTGDDPTLLTPPLSSGCLAGVLRTSLLCSRRARTEKITMEMLATRPFFVGNSLRGLIRAKLLQ
jgi:4-amino-4-deoxychorismate lyase